jgi:hypothetical protein
VGKNIQQKQQKPKQKKVRVLTCLVNGENAKGWWEEEKVIAKGKTIATNENGLGS